MTTAAEVAAWMIERLKADDALYQDVAVSEIGNKFGEEFVTINGSGNMAIAKSVLTAFNKLSGDVVWCRSERYWRFRKDFDLPGRQQP